MDPLGKCHLCQLRKPIRWCRDCQHWFCDACRYRYFWRGIEAVIQMIGGRRAGCCGFGG